MEKHWYIIYTKRSLEKKVSSLLTRKRIENFFPVNCWQVKHFNKMKRVYEPLIRGYVFFCITEREIPMLKRISNVINMVYWKGQPAHIDKEEVEMLKDFTNHYRNIKVDKTEVRLGKAEMINDSTYSVTGNNVAVKANSVTLHLYSLGVILKAENDIESIQETGVSIFSNREKLSPDSIKKNLKSSLMWEAKELENN